MASDLTNIKLSGRATEIADTIYQKGYFDDRVTIAKLGLAYAISRYYKKFDLEEYDKNLDMGGLNYNVGSLDGDKSISEIISILYPDTQTPYRYARAIMCFGLEKLGELNDRGELYPIYELLQG